MTFEKLYLIIAMVLMVVTIASSIALLLVKFGMSVHSYITHEDGEWYTYEQPFENFSKTLHPREFHPILDFCNILVIGGLAVCVAWIWLPCLIVGALALALKYTRMRYQRKENFVKILKGEKNA